MSSKCVHVSRVAWCHPASAVWSVSVFRCRLLWNAPCRAIILLESDSAAGSALSHSIPSNNNRVWCVTPASVTFLPVLLCTRSALPYLFCARICLWPQWAVYSGKQDWQRIKVRARSRVIVSAVYLDPRPETAWNQRGGKSGASVSEDASEPPEGSQTCWVPQIPISLLLSEINLHLEATSLLDFLMDNLLFRVISGNFWVCRCRWSECSVFVSV